MATGKVHKEVKIREACLAVLGRYNCYNGREKL
jgi:hypothetical protein